MLGAWLLPRHAEPSFLPLQHSSPSPHVHPSHSLLLLPSFPRLFQQTLHTTTLPPIHKHGWIPRCADAETQKVQREADSEDDDVLVDILLFRLLHLIPLLHSYALACALQQSNRAPRTRNHYPSHTSISPTQRTRHQTFRHRLLVLALRGKDTAALVITAEQWRIIDDVIDDARDRHTVTTFKHTSKGIHKEGKEHKYLRVAQPGIHLVIEEEVHVGTERETKHEEREDDNLRPWEALDLDLRVR